MKFKEHLNESADINKTLLTKLQKIGEAAHRIQLAKYKLEDRLEAVGKIMQKKNIKYVIAGGTTTYTQEELLNNAGEVLFNMMA